jgi:hypothetical protein
MRELKRQRRNQRKPLVTATAEAIEGRRNQKVESMIQATRTGARITLVVEAAT